MKKLLTLFAITFVTYINAQVVTDYLDLFLPFNNDLQNHSSSEYDLLSDSSGMLVPDRYGNDKSAFSPTLSSDGNWNHLKYERKDSLIIQNDSSFSLSLWVYGLENEKEYGFTDIFLSNNHSYDYEFNFGFGNGDIQGLSAGGGFIDYYNESFDELLLLGTGDSYNDRFEEWNNSNNGWHHIVITNSSDSMMLFVDTIKETSVKKELSQLKTFTRSFIVGTVFQEYVLDEVAFYTDILTNEEISQIFNYDKLITNLNSVDLDVNISDLATSPKIIDFNLPEIRKITLYSSQGKKLEFSQDSEINLSNCGQGLHYLTIESNKYIKTIRVLIY